MTESQIVTRTSESGQPYPVLQSPCAVKLKAEKYSCQDFAGGYKVHHVYVKCAEIRTKALPLDANPREPGLTPQVKAMQECLRLEPVEFVKKNNGLTTICEGASWDEASGICEILFGSGEGVCNGGHTYFSIVTSSAGGDALVHMELLQLPSGMSTMDKTIEITKIARARNSNNHLLLRSEADFLNYYEPLKSKLPHNEFVSWHENDSNAIAESISADDLIRMLSAIDPVNFYHPAYAPKKGRHKPAVTSGKSINSQWFQKTEEYKSGTADTPPLVHVAPLMMDLFEIRDVMAENFTTTIPGSSFRQYRLYQEQIKDKTRKSITHPGQEGFAPPSTIEIMLLGLFRTNVWLHFTSAGMPDLVGWVLEPKKLWELRRADVLEGLASSYNESDGEPTVFIRSDSPYRLDFFFPGVGQPFPNNPEVIYSIIDGTRYIKVVEGEATHYFAPDSSDGLKKIDEPGRPDNAIFYKVCSPA